MKNAAIQGALATLVLCGLYGGVYSGVVEVDTVVEFIGLLVPCLCLGALIGHLAARWSR